jgi:hypothetical protein
MIVSPNGGTNLRELCSLSSNTMSFQTYQITQKNQDLSMSSGWSAGRTIKDLFITGCLKMEKMGQLQPWWYVISHLLDAFNIIM